MSTYLVTGAAGFIASRTAHQLLEQGHSVIGIDNMNDYYDVRVKEHRLAQLQQAEAFHFVQGDIESLEDLRPLFQEHDIAGVLNLAARAGVRYSMSHPHVYLSTNTLGTLNLLEMMKEHQVKKLVLASTSSLYAGQEMPFLESLPVNTPISPYAASKKGAEVMAYSYHNLYDIDVSVVRYFTVYGPAGRPDMSIFRFIKWIDDGTPIELFGDGEQSRDFTYVEDIASGTVAALKEVGYEIFNLGGGNNPISLNWCIAHIEQQLGKKAVIDQKPFHQADMMSTWANIDKAQQMLGWQPTISLEDGLQRSVAWYQENKNWIQDIRL